MTNALKIWVVAIILMNYLLEFEIFVLRKVFWRKVLEIYATSIKKFCHVV